MTETESFGNYLRRRFHEWEGKQLPRKVYQADWAKWMGVKSSTLSTWVNDEKIPTGENVDALATKLGMEVYDLLGLPRRMPKEKRFSFIGSIWSHLSNQGQDQLYEHARNIAEQEGIKGKTS